MEKLDGMSMNVEREEMEKLKTVFPQCFAEGKLDIDKLLSLCGEYIDNDFEKYKFEWKGKLESLRLAQKRSTGTLRPCREESVNFDDTQNLYIEGDNLEVLKLLQTAYYNKIKMIYIDPPYNTSNDFVYEDSFADPMARYKEITQQTTKSNPETMGRYHTNWLNMMYPRLRLASNLLTDDGVIFISIDNNEVFNLKKVCDEVFGEENFINCVSVASNPRGRQSDTFIASVNDYLLVYAKDIMKCLVNGAPLNEEQKSEYKYTDSDGRNYRLLGLRQRGVASRRIDRPDMYFPIYVDKDTKEIHMDNNGNSYEVLPHKSDGTDGRWMWGKEKCKKDIHLLVPKLIESRNEYDIFVKDYISRDGEERTRKFTSIWDNKLYNNQNGTQEVKKLLSGDYMSYPKSRHLITDICRMGSSKECIVMDFFSGSATLAHSIFQLNLEDNGNRRFICIQLPEPFDEKSEAFKAGYKNICEIGKERIRRAGKEILEENTQVKLGDEGKKPLDVGFKVFKLDTSNLKTWDSTPIEKTQIDLFYERLNAMIDTVKDDRTDMDVVYEVMLKMGIPLDVPVTYIEVNEKIVYIVGEFLLMVCLANKITAEDIEGMAAYAPAKIICAEAGFADDSALSNAHYILRDRSIELKLV